MKDTKKLLNAAKKFIAERKLFLSDGFAKALQALSMSVTKAFKKPPVMMLFENPDPRSEVAYTDSKAIHVNFAHYLIQTHYGRKATMWEKVNAIKALVMHEAAHIAKTDFDLAQDICNKMKTEKKLWPLCNYADKVPNAPELLEYCETHGERILKEYMAFDNTLEDSYINNWLRGKANCFSGMFSWFLNKSGDYSPSFEEMLEMSKGEEGKYHIACGLLLDYAVHDKIKCDKKNEKHELIEHLKEIEDEVDAILDDDDAFYRIAHYQKIFCHYWPYLKAMLDSKEDDESGQSPMSGPAAAAPSGNGGAQVSKQPRSSTDEEVEEMMSAPSQSSEGDPDEGEDGVANAISNGNREDQDSEEDGNKKDTGLEQLLNDLANEEVNNQLNAESEANMSQISKGVNNKYSENLTCRARRIPSNSDDKREYEDLARKTDPITKALAKYFLQKFRDGRDGDRRTGLFSGTGIDWDAEARDELATFYKEDDPEEGKPLAVAYLGDESGSMYGQKAEMNRLTAITVYNFCDMLDLPVGVYGHTSCSGADCDFRIYADFRKDPNDRYRMMSIEGDAGNKDGYALRLASERLLAQDAEYKVLIITSDGLPSDYRSREEGIHDIQDCIRTYSRKGIHYIAAAMDADKEQIKQIYGASFLDISDLKTMPKRLVSMIAKEL